MQTRSMTKKALSRSASLPVPAPSPDSQERVAESNDSAMTEALEVVSSDLARVEQARENEGAHEQHVRAQEMLNIMQAQVIVQAATQRNNEARLQQAFAETEALLHATAQALVQAHAKEQALETRRCLGEAIQHALVDAHSRAHAQAMQAAQERLDRFTTEIHQRIQSQLADAVNEVGLKGAEYIEGMAIKKLDQLRIESQADIDKSVEQAIVKLGAAAGNSTSDCVQQQLLQIRADVSKQLVESEKRSYDGAVSWAAGQAERLLIQAESRLVSEMDERLTNIETRTQSMVSDAVVRAQVRRNHSRSPPSHTRAKKKLSVF